MTPHQPSPDDNLQSVLRDADPAGHLDLTPAADITRKANTIMSVDTTAQQQSNLKRTPHRGRRWLLPAAGATAATAAAVGAVVLGSATTATTTLALPTPDPSAPAAACAPITPQTLQQRDRAFEARVDTIDGQTVTLEVTNRFKGDIDDRVSVEQPRAQDPSEVSPGQFATGRTYLISTNGDSIATCGQSGPADDALRSLYDQAYN